MKYSICGLYIVFFLNILITIKFFDGNEKIPNWTICKFEVSTQNINNDSKVPSYLFIYLIYEFIFPSEIDIKVYLQYLLFTDSLQTFGSWWLCAMCSNACV